MIISDLEYIFLIYLVYVSCSTTASATSLVSSISLSYFQALIIVRITSSCHSLTVHFVYRILFISNSNAALIIAEIIDAPVNIVVYH